MLHRDIKVIRVIEQYIQEPTDTTPVLSEDPPFMMVDEELPPCSSQPPNKQIQLIWNL